MSLSEALPTTAILTLRRSLHAEALQATVSEELAQGSYVAARAGFEPTTLRSKGIDSIYAPTRPHDGPPVFIPMTKALGFVYAVHYQQKEGTEKGLYEPIHIVADARR